ncbi:MAG: SGNH/GDSL hydrolase family protein [Enterobacterales bacterium endosymbiont of Blomia tropicalis]|uniref:SGNH/GDSL hydrolase family protein n=1 Tax=Mixta mediterraneensis TaxID=2758443 RepID=UPI0025A8AA34|nr:SGNH/GDSL hydrolase family protein [Mixta mediterraneensis]MDL4915874.1 SGNH/GDSL hydrolase family protein [Mixta mediterraneensis]
MRLKNLSLRPAISLVILYALIFPLQAAETHNEFIIAAYGGSSTKGVMAVKKEGKITSVIAKENEIALLNLFLRDKYGPGIRVINYGAPSAQALELLTGKYHYSKNKTWREEMKNSQAKIILLNFAMNDARHYHFKDIEPDYIVSPVKYSMIMSKLINIAREEGKAVIVQEPHPICGRIARVKLEPYVSSLNAVAQSESVPLVHQFERIKQIANWQTLMSPDCIHPSGSLYKIKAQETFAVIEKNFGVELAHYQQNRQSLDSKSLLMAKKSP